MPTPETRSMSPAFYRHDRPHLPQSCDQRGLPKVELEILRGRAQNRVRPVRVAAFLIGSATDCDLVLGDSKFPEAHCYLMLAPREVSLRWLGFGPEVAVNGQPIHRTRLRDGDHLRMGPYEFRISIRIVEPGPDNSEPRILRLNRIPPDDLDSAAREIRGLLAEIRRAAGWSLSDMRFFGGRTRGNRSLKWRRQPRGAIARSAIGRCSSPACCGRKRESEPPGCASSGRERGRESISP